MWALAIFFALSALVYFPSFSSLLAILMVGIVIPIPKWQDILAKFVHGKLKIIIAVSLALLTIFTAPTADVDVTTDNNPTITTENTTESVTEPAEEEITATESVGEATTETTKEPTEAVATEATTEPAVEVTTEVTTAPTTEPATEATTEPTTAPTTEPATEATTEPVTVPTTEPTIEPTTAPITEPPHSHSFSDVTCTAPKTCSCGATEGTASGHNWEDATCLAPMTCSVCGATSGTAMGHAFSNGDCTQCGEDDPNYVYETLVWIPTKGGKKYHSHAGCSNMEDPEQVTKSEAEDLGFEPCKRCY